MQTDIASLTYIQQIHSHIGSGNENYLKYIQKWLEFATSLLRATTFNCRRHEYHIEGNYGGYRLWWINYKNTYGNINLVTNLNVYNIEQGSLAEEALVDVHTNIS